MIIVGISGGIGHGKSTVARYLAANARTSRHWEAGDLVTEVANALRHERPDHPSPDTIAGINAWLTNLADITTALMHVPADFAQLALTEEQLHAHPENYSKLFEYLADMQARPQLQTEEITADSKQTFRPLLQWLGGYLVKTVDEGIWFNELVRRIRQNAASGLELATVGGVRFPGDAARLRHAGAFVFEVRRPGAEEADAQDITERERRNILVDACVVNDGTLEQLKRCATLVYRDLQRRSLQPSYKASDV